MRLTPLLVLWLASSPPPAMPRLDHVYVIMLENHAYEQVIGVPAVAPFVDRISREGNLARAYFAVGHPSLDNYLEVVGGSNFGVTSDAAPNWHAALPDTLLVMPIKGTGTDHATPAALTGATGGADIPAAPFTARTIADQLTDAGRSWKTYQEDLPASGPDRVDYSDGIFSNLSPVPALSVQRRYAVKHDPFAYFAHMQAGPLAQHAAGFAGLDGLYADLRAGTTPAFSFIVPEQCRDMHGLPDAGPLCLADSTLILTGDHAVEGVVNAIRRAPGWKSGKNAIVILWDENDFSTRPNRVGFIVLTNYGSGGRTSDVPYNHYSFLHTLEAAFGLPCLNHACDPSAKIMVDLFSP